MTGSASRSAADQNGSSAGSSSRMSAADVPISTPAAPLAEASSSTSTASKGACSGTLAIHRSRSGHAAANSSSPPLTARAIASPALASTW